MEYLMDLGEEEPRDLAFCPICSRKLFEMARPGMLVTDTVLPGDRTKCGGGDRHLGLPPEYDGWPFPTLTELLKAQR